MVQTEHDRLNKSEVIDSGATFKPDVAQTLRSRKTKAYSHTGVWGACSASKHACWSCCMSTVQDSRGCQSRLVDPDRWVLDGPAVL